MRVSVSEVLGTSLEFSQCGINCMVLRGELYFSV